MAKNDQEEQFEKIMTANLARIVDFLKFAETKNAALLTFCSAWILAILGALASQKSLPEFLTAGLRLSLPFFPRVRGSRLLRFCQSFRFESSLARIGKATTCSTSAISRPFLSKTS